MPRRGITTAVDGIEAKRLTKKRVREPASAKEMEHMQNIAVFLKLATYTHTEIAGALGLRKTTVARWFQEARVQKLYDEGLESISGAARQFLETLSINAVKRLGELVNHGDPKVALDAIREVLDRGGLPKLSRVEQRRDEHVKRDPVDDSMTIEFKVTTPEEADRIGSLISEAEKITKEASGELPQ